MDRNQHLDLLKALAAALEACNEAGQPGEPAIAGINVVPIDGHGNPDIDLHGDDFPDFHPVDLTESGLVEALKMLGATPAVVRVGVPGDAANTPEDAARFAQQHSHLAAQLTDVFTGINPLNMQVAVIDHREADLPDVIQAIDEVLGDQYDPYADEDDEL